MDIKNKGFIKGIFTNGANTDKVIDIFKESLRYLNVPYTDTCCEDIFFPTTGICNVVEVTYEEALTLMSSSSLCQGKLYNITDKEIYLFAKSTNEFNIDGLRLMYVPSTYTLTTDSFGNVWKGVFLSTTSYNLNDLVIWGGSVWKKITATSTATSTDNITLSATHFVKIDKDTFTKDEYTLLPFGINYDIANDWISKQWDTRNNILGVSFNKAGDFLANPVDISDWNAPIANFYGNECAAVYNNNSTSGYATVINNKLLPLSSIYNNYSTTATTTISENRCGSIYSNRTVTITGNRNTGAIYSNSASSASATISYNSNVGSIYSNTNAITHTYNSNIGNIFSNACTTIGYNSNIGDISSNLLGSSITYNSNAGAISSNLTIITYNKNRGAISSNLGFVTIAYNENNGSISSFLGGASFSVLNNTYNGDLTGYTLTATIDGKTPKTITTGTYTLQPYDFNNIYTNVGGVTVTVPSSIIFPHTSIHTATAAASSVTFSPAGGVTVSNYTAHTKSNGQYATATLFNTASNTFVLGGNTSL